MSPPGVRAGYLRGALVGACSALLAVGAHAHMGGSLPSGGAVVALLGACATVGATVAGIRIEGRGARIALIVGALAAGQFISHLMLTAFGAHHEIDSSALLTGPMFVMHASAALALGLLIGAVESFYVVCTTVLCWLRLFAVSQARPVGPTAYHHPSVVVTQYFLIGAGRGTRAPPPVIA